MHSPIQKLTSACVGSPTILTNQSIMTPLIIVLKMEEKKKSYGVLEWCKGD